MTPERLAQAALLGGIADAPPPRELTPERLAELQALLGTADVAEARRVWDAIEDARSPMQWFDDARRRVPRTQAARRRLMACAAAARKFAAFLKTEPLAAVLLNDGVFPFEHLLTDEERRAFVAAPGEFIRRVESVAEFARLFAEPDRFQLAHPFLMGANQGATSTAALILWPVLFGLWTGVERREPSPGEPLHQFFTLLHLELTRMNRELGPPVPGAGRTLSHTPDGPFHRFVKFVHRELELPAPSASALRHAIDRYIANREQK